MGHIGELAALGTACCWTVTALAFESAGRRIGSLAVNIIRLVMALGVLSLVGWLHRGLAFPVDASTHAWVWLSVSGLVGFTVGDLCLFRAFVVLGARRSMLLMALVPLVTALMGWLILGETLASRDWFGMALTLAGVTWVIRERTPAAAGQTQGSPLAGVLLGVGGAVGQAVGLVLSDYGMGDFDPFAATQIRVVAGTVGFAVVFSIIGWWPRVVAGLRNPPAMRRTAVGAFFGPFLGVSLSLLAVQHTQTGVASTIMALPPVLILPIVALSGRERVTLRGALGAVVAVAGTALLFL